MSEYLYVPDDDSEYGPIWATFEAREEFTAEQLEDAQPAELIVMRDGSRGHYLAACYLSDAANIVAGSHPAPEREDMIATWRRVSDAYDEHGGALCPGAEEITLTAADGSQTTAPGMCSDCEYIHDDALAAEGVLSDLGYVTTWNDGYTIHKVLDDESEES